MGLPTFSIRSKRIQFGSLRDRVAQKINGWKSKFFSEGGREILIKVVIQAILTYTISCFRIPSTIIGEIERMIAKFWWGADSCRSKVH